MGPVAEWSEALLEKVKINENQKDHRFAPRPVQYKKNPDTYTTLGAHFNFIDATRKCVIVAQNLGTILPS